jgi:hypothetical protein
MTPFFSPPRCTQQSHRGHCNCPHPRRPHHDIMVGVTPRVNPAPTPPPTPPFSPYPLHEQTWVEVTVEHSSPSHSFVRVKLTQPRLRAASSQSVGALLSAPSVGDHAPMSESKSSFPHSGEHRLRLVSIRFR